MKPDQPANEELPSPTKGAPLYRKINFADKVNPAPPTSSYSNLSNQKYDPTLIP